MKLSEMIETLSALKEKHGDISVALPNEAYGYRPFFYRIEFRHALRGDDADLYSELAQDDDSLGDYFIAMTDENV